MNRTLLPLLIAVIFASVSHAQPKKKPTAPPKYDASVPPPTEAGVRYGEHPRHVLDFWQAKSDKPTPVAFVIHGGGWMGGSKERLPRFADPNALLEAGISVVAINYRYVSQAVEEGIKPPVKAPLHDAARALQFVRSNAERWKLDKERIGAAGGSAGACSSLWLAFHDDMAEPGSKDPIARESTRLWCAAVTGAQTSLDPKQMKEWTPNSRYGGHAFGLPKFPEFLAKRDEILPWIKEYSPYALVSSDDPPVYLTYSRPPAIGKDEKDPTHTANFGVKLQEHCNEVGVGCELAYPGAPGVEHENPTEFLIATLNSEKPAPLGKKEREEFVPLYNGKDLEGWVGEEGLWKVEDGIIIGTCKGPEHMTDNSFLIWEKGSVKDFELRVVMRVIGDNNSGVQYRSRRVEEKGPYVISGYQCDVHPGLKYTGMTYEEKGRGIFGHNGQKVLLGTGKQRWLLSEHAPVEADVSNWQEYSVVAKGNHLVHMVNGKVTSELIDCDDKGFSAEGLIAIQLHRGKENRVEIKEILLRELPEAEKVPFKVPDGAKKL